MATMREMIQAKIDSVRAVAEVEQARVAEELTTLEAHLRVGGTWLDQEFEAFEGWAKGLVERVRAAL